MRTVLIIALIVLVLFVVILAFALCKATADREQAFQEIWNKTRRSG